MRVLKSASVPRLPGIPAPSLTQVLRSGFMYFDKSADGTGLKLESAYRSTKPGKNSLGQGYMFPMNKGLMFFPMLDIFDLALSGDLKAIADMVGEVGKGFAMRTVLGPLYEPVSSVGGLLDLDLRTESEKKAEAEEYFQKLLAHDKTFCLPYCDIVDVKEVVEVDSITRNFKGMWLTVESANGERDDYLLGTYDFSVDFIFERRWRYEFDWHLVQIVQEAIDGPAFWQAARKELERRGINPRPSAGQRITLESLEMQGLPLRFYLGADPEGWDVILDLLEQQLAAVGFQRYEAIALVFLIEDVFRRHCMVDGDKDAWIVAMTDQKLAGALLERMKPNLEGYRAALRENSAMRLEYTLSYVDMLERCARGEPLGRVNRLRSGPFY